MTWLTEPQEETILPNFQYSIGQPILYEVEPVLFLPAIIDHICLWSNVYTIKILEYKECEDGFFDGILDV